MQKRLNALYDATAHLMSAGGICTASSKKTLRMACRQPCAENPQKTSAAFAAGVIVDVLSADNINKLNFFNTKKGFIWKLCMETARTFNRNHPDIHM